MGDLFDDAARRRRGPGLWPVVAVVAVVVAVVSVVWAVVGRGGGQTGGGPSDGPAVSGAPSSATSGGPYVWEGMSLDEIEALLTDSEFVSGLTEEELAALAARLVPEQAARWRTQDADQVVEVDVAPGLDRCASRAEGVNQEATPEGVGFSYPHTLEGAVAAAAGALRYRLSADFLDDEVGARTDPLVFNGDTLDTARDWAAMTREAAGLSGRVEPLDPDTGQAVAEETYYAAGYPRYGAYKILKIDGISPLSLGPDAVVMTWWLPGVSGIGRLENLDGVRVWGEVWTAVVQWGYISRDYKVQLFMDGGAPPLLDNTRTNVSYGERAELLGPGWCVPLDGIEEAIPGVVKAGR
ncbi:MAG: hypothetical protein LBK54_05920 [Propionibacteriaceae bacterium]|nr:hypothetical protein [Propionibacteriaceae bacterium]